jgi:hypothetical protein
MFGVKKEAQTAVMKLDLKIQHHSKSLLHKSKGALKNLPLFCRAASIRCIKSDRVVTESGIT